MKTDALPSNSPFTYDAVHNDYVCKACGRVFETDEEWCALAVDGKFEWREMRYCPLCGYPADMEIAELRNGSVFTVESVGDWAFSCMEGCDEPEFSMYSAINDAVERYKQGKYGKPSPERRYAHGSVECIDAIKAALSPEEWRGFVKGNVLKYVWREAYKGGDCDLEKARDYLGRYLEKGAADEPMEKA